MKKTGKIHFVLGGSRSGKSGVGERLAEKTQLPVAYLATCRTEHLDDEMKQRIERHKRQRPADWTTIENQFDLVQLAKNYSDQCILMDCLTLWLANELQENSIDQILENLERSMDALEANNVHCVIVSNELGMGIVPLGKETREYRDLVGWANQRVAKRATEMLWMVAGMPVTLKKDGIPCDLNTAAI